MSTIEIYRNYPSIGIHTRTITPGEEYNMVREFIEFRKDAFKEKDDNHLAVFIETKINDTYPDIVFAEYNPEKFLNWNKHRNQLTVGDLKILHYILTHKKTTSQKIVTDLSSNYRDLLLSLEKLYDAELIDRKDGKWIKNPENSFGVKRVEAVEAKISKWNQVLQQALINKSFASESSILSKRKNTLSEDIVNRTEEFGLGIYLYDEKSFSQYRQPQKSKFPNNYNSIFINECIGRILNT